MNRFLHTKVRLLMAFVLAAFAPGATLAHDGAYDDNGFCIDEECTEKYQPANYDDWDDWYEISNAGQLYWFANEVSNGRLTTAKVRLICDIIDNDVVFSYNENRNYAPVATDANGKEVDVNSLRVWKPTGTSSYNMDGDREKWFGGHFDGNGHTISGLYFNDMTSASKCGLFMFLYQTAVVENVGIVNSYLRAESSAGIAVWIEGATVKNCYNDGMIYGTKRAGGIVGESVGNIFPAGKNTRDVVRNSINAGFVYCESSGFAGGIIAAAYSPNCLLSCLYNVGKCNGEQSGEIIGSAKSDINLDFCYGYGSERKLLYQGTANSANSEVFTEEALHNGKMAYMISLSDNRWGYELNYIHKSVPEYGKVYKLCGDNYTNDANAAAEHNWENGLCTKCGDKQEAKFNVEKNCYEISSLGQLLWFNENFGLACPKDEETANASLTTDITINDAVLDYDEGHGKILVDGVLDKESSLVNLRPLGSTHNFEGNGHTISGLFISTNYNGKVGFCDGGVQNLTLSNAFVVSTSINGIGGFAGQSDFPITNCHFKGVVEGQNAGGFAWRSLNSITNCSFEGSVIGSDMSCGFVIVNEGSIKNCSFVGRSIEGKEIVKLVGFNERSGTIENCYTSTSTSEPDYKTLPCIIVQDDRGATGKIAYDNDKLSISSESDGHKMGFTNAQFKSGEVAYWLNDNKSDGTQAWYQKLGENGDMNPVLKATDDNTVYHGMTCDKKKDVFTNDNGIFNEDGVIHNFEIADIPDANGLYGDVCTECNENNESTKYIHNFCGKLGWDLKLAVGPDNSYSTEENVVLQDKAAYNSPVDFEVADFTYIRNNPHTEWQVYYVPFNINCSELANAGITAAYINNVHEYEKDGKTEVVLEVKEVTSGTLKANVPYVIKAAESGVTTLRANNVTLHRAEMKTIGCRSVTHDYSFKGIYKAQSGFNQDENVNDGIIDYTLTGGEFLKLSKTATLSPMRWYLTICERNKPMGVSSVQPARVSSIEIKVIGEGEVTGIEDIHVTTDGNASEKQGIFDLQGRRLNAEPAHGVYIKNGKKIIK